jgi:hypothetical protein
MTQASSTAVKVLDYPKKGGQENDLHETGSQHVGKRHRADQRIRLAEEPVTKH